MLRRVLICVIVAVAALTAADAASARQRRQIDATPFSHAPCSVLDGRPCTPYFCSVFNHGPCIPEIDYPINENLQVTVQSVPSRDDAAKYQKPDPDPLCRQSRVGQAVGNAVMLVIPGRAEGANPESRRWLAQLPTSRFPDAQSHI